MELLNSCVYKYVSALPEMTVTVQMIFNQGSTLSPAHSLPESKIDNFGGK